jgi:hypothetical protein
MTEASNDPQVPLPDMEHCRARRMTESCEVVDCLVANPTCNHALAFGYGYLCQHPRRKEIVELIEARLASEKASSGGNACEPGP